MKMHKYDENILETVIYQDYGTYRIFSTENEAFNFLVSKIAKIVTSNLNDDDKIKMILNNLRVLMVIVITNNCIKDLTNKYRKIILYVIRDLDKELYLKLLRR